MIDGQAAASLARDLLGRPQDADRPWRLMAFPEGYFPSHVAPDRIGALRLGGGDREGGF